MAPTAVDGVVVGSCNGESWWGVMMGSRDGESCWRDDGRVVGVGSDMGKDFNRRRFGDGVRDGSIGRGLKFLAEIWNIDAGFECSGAEREGAAWEADEDYDVDCAF